MGKKEDTVTARSLLSAPVPNGPHGRQEVQEQLRAEELVCTLVAGWLVAALQLGDGGSREEPSAICRAKMKIQLRALTFVA